MVVGILTVTAHLPSPMSLKDKRSIVKGTLAKVKNHFNAAAAEVGLLDDISRTELGFSVVSNDHSHAETMLSYIENFLEDEPRMEIVSVDSEVLHV